MTGRTPRTWSEEEIAILRDFNLNPPQMAKKIGVSVPTVRRKMDELGIKRKHNYYEVAEGESLPSREESDFGSDISLGTPGH